MESNEKYEVIKRLAEGHISKSCAAIKIGCTIRTVNFTHCCELLRKHDSIQISPSALRTILLKEFILSPRATKKTKEQMKKNLKDQHKEAATQTEKS